MDKDQEGEVVEERLTNQIENESQRINRGGRGGKSCKGYLYYSSNLKSNGRNPRCIGIPRSLPQVPNYVIGQSEADASKEGRTLVDFYYACAGYSVYASKDHASVNQVSKTELPVCVGLELLVDRRASTIDNASAPAHTHAREGASVPGHVHTKEDGREFPHPRPHRPSDSGDDFPSRFKRNASLVALGVAKNLRRVGMRVKETVDDYLYPYRRRPK